MRILVIAFIPVGIGCGHPQQTVPTSVIPVALPTPEATEVLPECAENMHSVPVGIWGQKACVFND